MKRFLIFAALFLSIGARAEIDSSNDPSVDESISETLDLSDSIRSLLKNNAALSSSAQNIGIYQKHNCIILKGAVKSLEEKSTIGKIAEEASPGMKVINDIRIR